jgi:uncharacterized Fe-S cluster-containing MiaB family protein
MKRVLLVHLPFCTPVGPPYALANLYSFLKNNCYNKVDVLDLNLEFHKLKFPKAGNYFKQGNWTDYTEFSKDYQERTKKVYAENNKWIRNGQEPEFLREMLGRIISFRPDIVAFSLIYSSQIFYAHAIITKLQDKFIIVGGPAVNDKLSKVADETLHSEVQLLQFMEKAKDLNLDYAIDFSKFDLDKYFTPEVVLPLKTSTTCFYKGCKFCAHYAKVPYFEYGLNRIRETIENSSTKHFFLIDDMVPVDRLIKLSEVFSQAGGKFACQLRPRKEFTKEKLEVLAKNGLDFVIWGVESGNNRVLEKINKGTNVQDIEEVLGLSSEVGIKNIVYIMFGFPTETQEEFQDTITFLKRNAESITLVSPSVFGLQKGTPIYLNPEKYGITEVVESKRQLLGDKISYQVYCGLSNKEVLALKRKNQKVIESINKVPKAINFFREHMFFV